MYRSRHQLWAKLELIEGTDSVPTISEAVYAGEVSDEGDWQTFNLARVANSLDSEASLVGQKRRDLSFSLDLKGGGATATVPQLPEVDLFMRTSGFRRLRTYYLTGTAITGSIAHGATFSQATSGATGVIIGSYSGTPTKVHFLPTSGTVDASHLVTCTNPDATTATFTTGGTPAVTAHGYKYVLATDRWSKATHGGWSTTPTIGETVKGDTSLAVGTLLQQSNTEVWIQIELGTFQNGENITGQSSGAQTTLSSTVDQEGNVSASIYRLLDRRVIKRTGARSDMSIPLRTGEPCKAVFGPKGFQSAVAATVLGAATYASASRPTLRFVSANFTLDGKGFRIGKLEIAMNNGLAIEPDANALEGAVSYRISTRDPTVSIDPSDLPPDAYDFLAKAAASTLVAAKVRMNASESGIHSASAQWGAIVWIDMPNIQYDPPKEGDREGTVTAEITGRLRRGSAAGDDSISFFFL